MPRRLSAWYVTGLCEGDGSFTFYRNGPKNVALVFALKQPAAGVRVLEDVRAYFGCGSLYASERGAALRIVRAADLLKILAHFDKHPLKGKKARRYALWREAVLLKQRRYRVDQDKLDDVLAALARLRDAGQA